ncbi:hypothetical protein Cyrtocomes_00313 [Candidatus Cyrtobacter comes]|uniref:DUF4156 domain-containing protein n=1 Tax=Candidatus Cyrtobacter comes TaxID=675776 RepID=A0ABU5L7Z6_9RICK|nr:hypothetical protein [Candidatus Cyrtobacter comes]MDZ5761949.1 hypothetical protein [Candidatus Cyrtobacter comes]
MKRIFALSICAIVVSGCFSSTIVIPESDGKYKLVSASSRRSDALSDGVKEAGKYCKKRKLDVSILSSEVQYKGGMDPTTKQALASVTSSLARATGSFQTVDTSEDYEATIIFTCK